MASRSSRYEYRLSLIPIDFSLTAGTAIPAPLHSPPVSPVSPHSPTLVRRSLSSHPSTSTRSLKSCSSRGGPLSSHPPSPRSGSDGRRSPAFETASQRHLERINSRRRSEVPFLAQTPVSPVSSPISPPPSRPSLSTINDTVHETVNANGSSNVEPQGRRSMSTRRLLSLFSKKDNGNLFGSAHNTNATSSSSPQSTQSSLNSAGYSSSAGFGISRPDSSHTVASSVYTGSAGSTSPAPRPNLRRKKSGSWFGLVGKRRSGMWSAEFAEKVTEDHLGAVRRKEMEKAAQQKGKPIPQREKLVPVHQRVKSFYQEGKEMEEEPIADEMDDYEEPVQPISPVSVSPPPTLPDFMLDGGSLGGSDIFRHIR